MTDRNNPSRDTLPAPVHAVLRLVESTRALLRQFNPTQLAEGASQQWEATWRQCDIVASAVTDAREEPHAWYRDDFVHDFSKGPERPRNATSNPNEWKPLYATPQGSARVRPLVWHAYPDEGPVYPEGVARPRRFVTTARLPWNAVISITEKDGVFSLDGAFDGDFDTEEAAVAGAEVKYEQSVLAALMGVADESDVAAPLSKGWRRVPDQATLKMETAALEGVRGFHDVSDKDWKSAMPRDFFRIAWKYMLAAAPEHTDTKGDGR